MVFIGSNKFNALSSIDAVGITMIIAYVIIKDIIYFTHNALFLHDLYYKTNFKKLNHIEYDFLNKMIVEFT